MKKKYGTVLEMNDELFKFRRRIIGLLYEAKQVLGMELPRLKVRVVKYTEDNTLGMCHADKNYITISEKMAKESENILRQVVWHEIAHAFFKAPHKEGCPLMDASLQRKATKKQLEKALKNTASVKKLEEFLGIEKVAAKKQRGNLVYGPEGRGKVHFINSGR